MKAVTSISTACAKRRRAPERNTDVKGSSENDPGWRSSTTLSSLMAYPFLMGIGDSVSPGYAAFNSSRHQLSGIARRRTPSTTRRSGQTAAGCNRVIPRSNDYHETVPGAMWLRRCLVLRRNEGHTSNVDRGRGRRRDRQIATGRLQDVPGMPLSHAVPNRPADRIRKRKYLLGEKPCPGGMPASTPTVSAARGRGLELRRFPPDSFGPAAVSPRRGKNPGKRQ